MAAFFKVVGTGSREWEDQAAIFRVLDALIEEKGRVLIAHGGARGADKMMTQWAIRARGRYGISRVALKVYPAKWRDERGNFSRRAGLDRNELMINEVKPDLVVAFIRQASRGATHCAQYAADNEYEVFIFRDDTEPVRVEPGTSIVLPKGL